jgi:glutathione S-transferase
MTLNHKKVAYDIEFVDLANRPAWLADMSPLGEVPILIVDGKDVIFDSAVICEFLDEITPGHLLPESPMQRAINRSWIGFAGTALKQVSATMHARDEDAAEKALAVLRNKMCWLQGRLECAPYFNGQQLSLVDFAYAPLFMRMKLMGLDEQLDLAGHYPKVQAWSEVLLGLAVVQNSVVSNFEELFKAHVVKQGPYTAQRLGWN